MGNMDKNKVLRIAGIVAAALIAIYAFGVLTDSDRGFDKVCLLYTSDAADDIALV